MKVKGWPRAINDETFTSWLFRSAQNINVRTFSLEMGEGYYLAIFSKNRFESDFDSDFDFESGAFGELCANRCLPEAMLSAFFKPRSAHLCMPAFRFSFCAKCIREDIRVYGLPAWRKSWCYVTNVICVQHRSLLEITSEIPSFYKPWDAFATEAPYCDPQHIYMKHSRRWGGISSKLLDLNIVIKVQNWLSELEREKYCLLPGDTSAVLTKDLNRAVGLLIKIFLSSRTRFRGPGAARCLFNEGNESIVTENLSYRESMEFGSGSASPYHRMIAILMVGYVFRLFTKEEILKIRRAAKFSGYSWPKSVEALGFYSPFFHSEDEYLDLISDFSFATDCVHERLAPFLIGVEYAAYKSKVLSDDKMKYWKSRSPIVNSSYQTGPI